MLKTIDVMRRAVLAGLLAALAWVQAAPVSAAPPEIRALVIGINKYGGHGVHSLKGAVNDAQDVAAALRELGASVTVMLDDEVSRSTLQAAWRRLQEGAPPHSLLIFHYSGHSADAVEQTSAGPRMFDYLVFGGFHGENRWHPEKEPEQSLTGHELRQWIKEAAAFRVLTVYDSCTSGTLFRRPQAATVLGARSAFDDPAYSESPTAAPPPRKPDPNAPGVLPQQVFVAGAPLGQQVKEMLEDGRAHGALSYYFAKLLRGDGGAQPLTTRRLFSYIRDHVRAETGGEQDPELLTGGSLDDVLLNTSAVPPPPLRVELPRIKVAPVADAAHARLADLQGVDVVGSGQLAELRVDPVRQQVISAYGEIVAYDVDPDDLQAIANKWRHVTALGRLAARGLQDATLVYENDKQSARGVWLYKDQRLGIRIPNLNGRQAAVVNLSSNGIVQMLYPLATERPNALDDDGGLYVPVGVSPPYGADHILVVSSPDPGMSDLVQQLQNVAADALYRLDSVGTLLGRISALRDVRVNLLPLFSCESPEKCPNHP